MTREINILALVEAGRQAEAMALLTEPVIITAALGPRSARAALEAATRLFGGDVEQTARWMSRRSAYLGASPCEFAERSEEDLQKLLTYIRGLEAGVYF